jgi:cell division septal protein FtsQ
VTFTLPFDLPVDIKALEASIRVSAGDTSFAELAIPKEPVRTDVQQRIIHLTFSNVPFAVFGGQHSAFQQFLASTTMSTTESVILSGQADTDADTSVGLLSLRGIEFSVKTSIAGLQGLTSKPTLVQSLDVNRGFPNYLLIKANSSLFNPR